MNIMQGIFRDEEGELFGGILVNEEYVICGECGSVFEIDDVEILEYLSNWVNIGDVILGD